MKTFEVIDLLSHIDSVATDTASRILFQTHIFRVYNKPQKKSKNVYIPKWYNILPTTAIIIHSKNGKKKRELNSKLLQDLLWKASGRGAHPHDLQKLKIKISLPRNIEKIEFEIMSAMDLDQGKFFDMNYLTWTKNSITLHGNELLYDKKCDNKHHFPN